MNIQLTTNVRYMKEREPIGAVFQCKRALFLDVDTGVHLEESPTSNRIVWVMTQPKQATERPKTARWTSNRLPG